MKKVKGNARDAIVASELKARPVDWLWQERIPRGMLSVVAGKPDQGKGLLGARIAADVSSGKASGRRENVLFSAIEDDPNLMTKPRLEAAGADLDHVLTWRFLLPNQFKQLEEMIVVNEISLVVMDPFAGHLGKGVSRHSDNVRTVTSPLSELAERTGCTFLIIEHALKGAKKNAEPLAAIGGVGSGLPAASRMAYLYGKDPKNADMGLLAPVKSNLRERPKALGFEIDVTETEEVDAVPYLVTQEEQDIDASILLEKPEGNATPGAPPDKRAQAAEWLTRYLHAAGEPVKAGEVMEDGVGFGMTRKTMRRAASDMGIIKTPPGGGKNCTWALDPEVKKALDDAENGVQVSG